MRDYHCKCLGKEKPKEYEEIGEAFDVGATTWQCGDTVLCGWVHKQQREERVLVRTGRLHGKMWGLFARVSDDESGEGHDLPLLWHPITSATVFFFLNIFFYELKHHSF